MTNEQKEHFLLKVADFEGFRSTAYYCPARCLSIGFGHRITDNERQFLSLAKLTFKQAFDLLKSDFEKCLKHFENAPFQLEEHQLYALADIVYNCGWTNFSKGSLIRLCTEYSDAINNHQFKKADELEEKICNTILQYCHYRLNGKVYVSEGLQRRRKFDVSIFMRSNSIFN